METTTPMQRQQLSVAELAEARKMFVESRTYCRKNVFKFKGTPEEVIKYYFHWYRFMLGDGRVKNFDDFVYKVFVPAGNAKIGFNFIYWDPFFGKKIKKQDEIIIEVAVLMLDNIEHAKLLFEQDDISREDILYFLENKTTRVMFHGVQKKKTQKTDNSDQPSEKNYNFNNQADNRRFSSEIKDSFNQEHNTTTINVANNTTNNYFFMVEVEKEGSTPIVDVIPVQDGELFESTRDAKPFEDYLHHDSKVALMAKLHELLDGEKGKVVCVVIEALKKCGMLAGYGSKATLYRAMREEFGEIGTDSGLNQIQIKNIKDDIDAMVVVLKNVTSKQQE